MKQVSDAFMCGENEFEYTGYKGGKYKIVSDFYQVRTDTSPAGPERRIIMDVGGSKRGGGKRKSNKRKSNKRKSNKRK